MISTYGRMVWQALREYAVWAPGENIRLGDYGVVRDGCFQRAGSLSDAIGDFQLKTRLSKLEGFFCTSAHAVQVRGSADDGGLASVHFSFGKDCGSVLSITGVSASTVENLRDLAGALEASASYERKFQVVTTVRKAESLTVLISGSSGGEFSVSAKHEILDAFLQGGPDITAGLKVEGTVGLQVVGKTGPVSVQLHRLKVFGTGFRHLGNESSTPAKYGLVPVFDPVE